MSTIKSKVIVPTLVQSSPTSYIKTWNIFLPPSPITSDFRVTLQVFLEISDDIGGYETWRVTTSSLVREPLKIIFHWKLHFICLLHHIYCTYLGCTRIYHIRSSKNCNVIIYYLLYGSITSILENFKEEGVQHATGRLHSRVCVAWMPQSDAVSARSSMCANRQFGCHQIF